MIRMKLTKLIYRLLTIRTGLQIERRFPLVKSIRTYVLNILKREHAVIEGHQMFLGRDTSYLSIRGIPEQETPHIVKKHVRKGDVVFDVGANIGYYTLVFADLAGPQGKVFAFEPEPDNLRLLRKNVAINRYHNIQIVSKALSNRNGTAKLYLSQYMGLHSFYRKTNRWTVVECIPADDFYSGRINFVKIDVEYAEIDVLNGMKNLIESNRPKVLIESTHNEEKLDDFFVKRGFSKQCRCDNNTLWVPNQNRGNRLEHKQIKAGGIVSEH